MTKQVLRIATRESPLALWQAEYVGAALRQCHPGLRIELLPMTTRGDQVLDSPLSRIGGKGLFMKELEVAMLDGRADIAVHSMKDVPMFFPEGLQLAVICEREDCRDAFVSAKFSTLDELPAGAIVGSSSLRRQCQLKSLRPDIAVRDLRGNVNTRLRKLDAGEYDAIILAAAGLKRLNMVDRITAFLDTGTSLPAGGQGAIGIECRQGDEETLTLLQPLAHRATTFCVLAERAMNTRLNGGCQVPIACLAELRGEGVSEIIHIRGLVGEPDGSRLLRSEQNGPVMEGARLGELVAEDLLSQGANDILARLEAS